MTPERPAEQLRLSFARHPRSGTYLAGKRCEYPYLVTRAFRLDRAPADLLSVIVQSAGGALLGGDHLRQAIDVGGGAAAHVTSQAALPVHRMKGDAEASESVTLRVGSGGWAEWLPSPRLLFPGARLRQSIDVELGDGGVLMLADGFAAVDPDGGGRRFDRYASDITVRDPQQRLLTADRLTIEGVDLDGTLIGGFAAHGVLLAMLPPARAALDAIVESWNERWMARSAADGRGVGVYAGASVLAHDLGIAVRVAARHGSALRETLRGAWSDLRVALTGVAPGSRRIS
ncbi:MAG: urease accessory protein UreD [Burkholderiaceae bacterium]